MTTDVTLIKSEVTWTVWKEEYGWRYGWQAACRGSSRYAPEAVYAPITDDQHEDIRSSPQSHRPIDQWLHGNHWLLGKCVYYSAGEWLLEVGVPKTVLQLLWLPVPIARSLHGRRQLSANTQQLVVPSEICLKGPRQLLLWRQIFSVSSFTTAWRVNDECLQTSPSSM